MQASLPSASNLPSANGPSKRSARRDAFDWTALHACVLALAVLWSAFHAASALGLTVERVELITYLAVGAALAGFACYPMLVAPRRRVVWLDRSSLTLSSLVATAVIARGATAVLLMATLLSAAWVLVLTRSRNATSPATNLGRATTIVVALLVGWILAARLMWWTSFDAFAREPPTFATLAAAISLSAYGLFARSPSRAPASGRWPTRALHGIALAVFVVLAFRSDHIEAAAREPALDILGHTYSIVAPVELVRDRGWLLWDVASNYGFLNVWLVSALPIGSAWKSLWVFNAVLVAGCALATYVVSRFERRSAGHALFALVVTVTVVFYGAGFAEYLKGPESYVMVGPFRFVWVYVLLGLLFLEARATDAAGRRTLWLTGTLSWALGCLWSPESLLFGSVVWLPAYCLLVWRDVSPGSRARLLVLPPLTLAIAVVLVSCVYLVGLGHLPDYRSYFEFVFASDKSALPVDAAGGFWIYLVLVALLAALAWQTAEERDHRHLPLLLGCAGGVFAVFGYFVPRSHENNLLNVFAPSWFAVALACRTARAQRGTMPLALGCLLLPILAVLMTIVFGRPELLADNLRGLRLAYVDPTSGPDDPVGRILARAHVEPNDPVSFVAMVPSVTHVNATGQPLAYTHALAPLQPFVNLMSLDPEAQRMKIARFVTRTQRSGWLVTPTSVSPATVHEMFDAYYDFDPAKGFRESGFRIVWLTYRARDPLTGTRASAR
jgi:hypothetical protein